MVNGMADIPPKTRSISVSLYMAALLISALIFAAGVYLGQLLERQNLGSVSAQMDLANQKASSLELLYLVGDSPRYCPVYAEELLQIDKETEQAGYQLSYLEEKKGIFDNDLKKRYFMLESTAFLLSQKVREKCGANYSTVLYFYSIQDCGACKQQGTELLNLKKKLGDNVKIYSFDGEMGSAIVGALKADHSVSSYPSIVVDGNRTYSGLSTEKQVLDLIMER
jgi:hypothetical protein